jgi:photosystem II stability/assembly factor-like uncharacterized protein
MRKLLFLLSIAILAAPVFGGWRRANLFGADVRALIIDPAKPDTLYLGTSGGEVYVSDDGAHTWRNPRGSVPFPGYVVDNLVLDREGRLWAACWSVWDETGHRGVVAVSTDGGVNWTRRDNDIRDVSIRAIAVDAHDAGFIVVGGLTGVFRSTDGGESWTKISDQANVESLALDPRTHDRIYVGTWRQGTRTDDGGRTWKLINNGMVLDTDMFSITVAGDDPDNLWVSTCGWVYNTKNRGENWTRYRDGFNNRRIHDIEVDPCRKDALYAGSVAGLYRSEDNGKSWYLVSDESLVVNTIALHPQRPDRVILGVEGDGVYISNDAGKQFTRSCEGLRNLTITTIAADPRQARRVYAAVAFGGASSGIYRSNDAGATWARVSTTALPQVLSLTVTEDEAVKFVAGTEKGFFVSNDAVEWQQAEPSSFPIRVDKVVRYNNLRFFAATNEGVFTSGDSGRSWHRLAGSDNRTVDIAVGYLGERRALYALTLNGVIVYDGASWQSVANAPARGRTLAVRNVAGTQLLFVAGFGGVKAGHIGADRKWQDADVPDAQSAVVFGGEGSVYLASRWQNEVLVTDTDESYWRSVPLPSGSVEITSIVNDPHDAERLYIGTLGEGVYIFEGKPQKMEPKRKTADAAVAAVGGTQ